MYHLNCCSHLLNFSPELTTSGMAVPRDQTSASVQMKPIGGSMGSRPEVTYQFHLQFHFARCAMMGQNLPDKDYHQHCCLHLYYAHIISSAKRYFMEKKLRTLFLSKIRTALAVRYIWYIIIFLFLQSSSDLSYETFWFENFYHRSET